MIDNNFTNDEPEKKSEETWNSLTKEQVKASIQDLFTNEGYGFRPNIQFVAVNQRTFNEKEEKYDGFKETFEYDMFVNILLELFKPTLISQFVNKNSGNQCNVYQFINPNYNGAV